MNLNEATCSKVADAGKQLVVVTKYFDKAQTEAVMDEIQASPVIVGVGENRTEALETKNLNREQVHFIGRLQSRQLATIAKYCATIHSLASLKHARILNEKTVQPLRVFIQVNVAQDPNKEGIAPEEVNQFIDHLSAFKHLEIVGLSSMGWGDFERVEKEKEFKNLIDLRDQHLPKGLTSAGTSRDFEIALDQGIDIVRVGHASFTEDV